MADVTKTLKDAAYVAVGLGVIGFQKAQVRRQELRKDLAGRSKELSTQVEEYGTKLRGLARELPGRVEPVVKELEQRIDPVLDELEGRLPVQAQQYVAQARQAAKGALGRTGAPTAA